MWRNALGADAWNPVFDVTPASLVDAIGTEIGVIEALCDVVPPTHFKMVTVLLEQLTYKANPELQYQVFNPIAPIE